MNLKDVKEVPDQTKVREREVLAGVDSILLDVRQIKGEIKSSKSTILKMTIYKGFFFEDI